jgi:hypothetical protein
MATYGKPVKNHRLRNIFLQAALQGAMAFGSYQFFTPDTWKDAIGQKVEHVTGSKVLGHATGTLHPWQKTIEIPVPGK